MLRLATAGVLLASAITVIVVDLRADWDCSTGGPQERLAPAAALLAAVATLLLCWSQRWRWRVLSAIGGGLLVFVTVASLDVLEAIGQCAD